MCKAALSLARLLQSRNRRKEACELLSDSLAELVEGNDVSTIREARSTMKELAGS